MDFKELQTKAPAELHRLLAVYRDKWRELRFKDSNKQLKNIREIRALKHEIAQVLTLLNKKENKAVKKSEVKKEEIKTENNQ